MLLLLRVVVVETLLSTFCVLVVSSLTHRGLRQMQALGEALRVRYEKMLPNGKVDFADVSVVSSNYRRTQHSAQALLGGMLPHHKEIHSDAIDHHDAFEFTSNDSSNEKLVARLKQQQSPADDGGLISSAEEELFREQEKLAEGSASGEKRPTVPVHIPTMSEAYINVYPLIPDIAKMMIELKYTMVNSQSDLAEQDRVSRDLQDNIPAFGYKVVPFSWSNSLDLLTSRVARLHWSAHSIGRRALLATEENYQ